MRLQVDQWEKEKKDREERLRIIAKRLDHLERAYRKEERPLLAKDYEVQQENDRATFDAVQTARLENSKVAHQQDLATKKRLSRMLDEFNARKDLILQKRGEEFEKRRQTALAKVEEEKAKRRKAVLKAREEERIERENQERIRREKEEEEQRLEEGRSCLPIVDTKIELICLVPTFQNVWRRRRDCAQRKRPLKPLKRPSSARSRKRH